MGCPSHPHPTPPTPHNSCNRPAPHHSPSHLPPPPPLPPPTPQLPQAKATAHLRSRAHTKTSLESCLQAAARPPTPTPHSPQGLQAKLTKKGPCPCQNTPPAGWDGWTDSYAQSAIMRSEYAKSRRRRHLRTTTTPSPHQPAPQTGPDPCTNTPSPPPAGWDGLAGSHLLYVIARAAYPASAAPRQRRLSHRPTAPLPPVPAALRYLYQCYCGLFGRSAGCQGSCSRMHMLTCTDSDLGRGSPSPIRCPRC